MKSLTFFLGCAQPFPADPKQEAERLLQGASTSREGAQQTALSQGAGGTLSWRVRTPSVQCPAAFLSLQHLD